MKTVLPDATIPFDALVLAGGVSSRMGRDKALLETEGRTWVRRAWDLAWAVGASRVCISGRAKVDYAIAGATVLLDHQPGMGPMGGVERGLETCREPLLLVVAVDMWRLRVSVLRRCLAWAEDKVGAVPRTPQGWEPLAAWYPLDALTELRARMGEGRRSLCGLVEAGLAQGWMREVDLEPGEVVSMSNGNTPEDLAKVGR